MIGDRSDYGFCLRHIGTYTAGGYDRKVEGDMGSQTGEKKLPEKIKVMYKAVRELIEEGADINRIKVSEITQRAGIGKGTAYEYFPNKEELISSALLYQMDEMYSQLGQQIAQKKVLRRASIMCFLLWRKRSGRGIVFLDMCIS